MAANSCPICSGEIMTYRRFLKASEPSAISVCQCCGARLKRHHATHKRFSAAALGVLGGAVLLLFLAYREVLPPWTAVALILGLCAGFALAVASLGWRPRGWVALDDPSRDLGGARRAG